MARRADHTREELMDIALTAGEALLRREGPEGFSARKAAAAFGYTVGTLYHVFGSYDDYLLHINARTLDRWYIFMEGAVKPHGGDTAIHALAQAYIAFARANYHEWSALFTHRLAEDRELPEWYVPKMARFFALTEQVLLPLAKDKAAKSARVLWAGIHGICVLALSGKLELMETDSAESLAQNLVKHYLIGLAHA